MRRWFSSVLVWALWKLGFQVVPVHEWQQVISCLLAIERAHKAALAEGEEEFAQGLALSSYLITVALKRSLQ